jgi:hypothetical protein
MRVSPSTGDVLDLATNYNIVDKRGAYFRYNDMLLGQGRENAKVFLAENPARSLLELERRIRGEARKWHRGSRWMTTTTSGRDQPL